VTSPELALAPELTLWRRLLGADFEILPQAVKALFNVTGHRYVRGLAEVEAGPNPFAKLVMFLAGFPCPGRAIPLTILFQAEGGADIWHRCFGRRRFCSTHLEERGLLLERFGALTFVFCLTAEPTGVRFAIQETRLFGRRLPAWLSPRISARQSEEGGRFRFEIAVDLPFAGRMARLVGLIDPPGRRASKGDTP
jgi:hypothetical protein